MSRDIREVIREEPLVRDHLLGLLSDGPRTVPELAAASGLPAGEVLIWIMSMRKYGYITERDAGDGYYRYAAVSKP